MSVVALLQPNNTAVYKPYEAISTGFRSVSGLTPAEGVIIRIPTGELPAGTYWAYAHVIQRREVANVQVNAYISNCLISKSNPGPVVTFVSDGDPGPGMPAAAPVTAFAWSLDGTDLILTAYDAVSRMLWTGEYVLRASQEPETA